MPQVRDSDRSLPAGSAHRGRPAVGNGEDGSFSDQDGVLRAVALAAYPKIGVDFLASLVEGLASALRAHCVFVADCRNEPPTIVRTLALWTDGRIEENIEYKIADTPCEQVLQGQVLYEPRNIRQLFPNDGYMEALKAESYWGTPLRNASGKVLGHLGVVDTSKLGRNPSELPGLEPLTARAAAELERIHADEDFQDSHRTLRALIEGTSDIMYLQDLETRYLLINPAGAAVLKKRVEDIVGKADHELFPPAAAAVFRAENDSVIASGEELVGEQTVSLGDRTRVFRTHKTPRRDADGRIVGVIGICRDVTETKRAEQRAHHAERLASIGTLAAGIAHEINNPLTSILLSAEVALDVKNEDPESLEKCLEDISGAAERAGRIVKNVLKFSKQEASAKEPYDPAVVARRARDLIRSDVDRKAISLDFPIPDTLPPVLLNPLEIEQALINVIRNAIEAADRGTVVEARAEAAADSVRFEVRDRGRGMTDEEISRAFDPFYTTRRMEGGTGLGLSITHGIVEQHGGRIHVESSPGEGAAVTIELPIHEASQADDAR